LTSSLEPNTEEYQTDNAPGEKETKTVTNDSDTDSETLTADSDSDTIPYGEDSDSDTALSKENGSKVQCTQSERIIQHTSTHSTTVIYKTLSNTHAIHMLNNGITLLIFYFKGGDVVCVTHAPPPTIFVYTLFGSVNIRSVRITTVVAQNLKI